MKIKRYIPKKPFILAGSGLALSMIIFGTAVTVYHNAQPPENDTTYRAVSPTAAQPQVAEQQHSKK